MNGGLYRRLNLEMLAPLLFIENLDRIPQSFSRRKFKLLLNDAVSRGVFNQNLAYKLYVSHPTIPILHSLPKYHKNIFPPPMRPIVSVMGALGELLGTWIDHHLQPLESGIPGYLRDTKHLVATLDGYPWSSNCSWWS